MLLNQSAILLKEVRLCYILSRSEMVIFELLHYYFPVWSHYQCFKYYGLSLASHDQWTVAHIPVKLHLWFVYIYHFHSYYLK